MRTTRAKRNSARPALDEFMQVQPRPAVIARAPASGHEPAARRRLKNGKEQAVVYLAPNGILQLKTHAVATRRSQSEIVAEALNDWFARHNLPRLA